VVTLLGADVGLLKGDVVGPAVRDGRSGVIVGRVLGPSLGVTDGPSLDDKDGPSLGDKLGKLDGILLLDTLGTFVDVVFV